MNFEISLEQYYSISEYKTDYKNVSDKLFIDDLFLDSRPIDSISSFNYIRDLEFKKGVKLKLDLPIKLEQNYTQDMQSIM